MRKFLLLVLFSWTLTSVAMGQQGHGVGTVGIAEVGGILEITIPIQITFGAGETMNLARATNDTLWFYPADGNAIRYENNNVDVFTVADDGITTILSTSNGATEILLITVDPATPANNDEAQLAFRLDPSGAGAVRTFGRVDVALLDITDGAETAAWGADVWDSDGAGTMIEGINIIGRTGQDEVVINNGSVDLDFRIESDGDVNGLFFESSTGRLALGTNTPAGIFNTQVANAATDIFFDTYSTAEETRFTLRKSNSNTGGTLTETTDGQSIGTIGWRGVDSGGNFDLGVQIQAIQDGASGTRVPMDLVLKTFNNSAVNANQLVLDGPTGNVGLKTASAVTTLQIGATSADDVEPDFSIVVDADSDAGGDTDDIFKIALVPVADPTTATWDFTSTQSAGYTFDKAVTIKTGDFDIGLTGSSELTPAFKIIADADSDAPDTDDTFQIILTQNADPTLATWDFTTTQSAGFKLIGVLDVFGGSSGATPDAFADEMVVQSNGRAGISILTPGSGNDASIMFGSAADPNNGSMIYFFDGGVAGDGIFQLTAGTQAIASFEKDQFSVLGTIRQETFVIRKYVSLSGATDDVATNWFTITTTDETGSADGGTYSVSVKGVASEGVAASSASNVSSVFFLTAWTRVMASAAAGSNSVISKIVESASADEGTGNIGTNGVTVTVTETSEFVQQVLLQVNTSGGTFSGDALVELTYKAFTTAPVIN